MTTFQAIIYGIVQGFTEFLPVSSQAHRALFPFLVGWPEPTGPLLGALYLGSFLAVMIYFTHDWFSLISSFVQVIIFRKRPMTLDERLPFFVIMASVPVALAWYYFQGDPALRDWSPLWIAASLVGFAIPLWFADSMSRRSKAMYDWNWLDSFLVGLFQCILLIPGGGRQTGAMTAGLFRNYSREAAAKFSFLCAAPILAAAAFFYLKDLSPEARGEVTWLSMGMAFVVTLLCGLLAIGGFMKHVQRKGMGQYAVYRILVAIGVCVVYFMRSGDAG